jgi:hypothetical protein
MAQMLLIIAIIAVAAYFAFFSHQPTSVERASEAQRGETVEMQRVREIPAIQQQAVDAQRDQVDRQTGESGQP